MYDYWFMIDGVSSADKHIDLVTEPPIQLPEERGEHKTVLGRAGDLFLPEGDEVYDPYITTLNVGIEGVDALREAQRWLRGDHLFTFCNEPDRAQRGRILAGQEFHRVSPGMEWFEGTIAIKLQPYKYRIRPQSFALTSGAQITNLGDLTEYPTYTVEGSGDFSISVDDGAPLTLAVESAAVLECGILAAHDGAGFLVTSGPVPVIPRGIHTVTFSPGFSVTITRKERFL